MDKRFFLALFLSLIAIAVSQLLFPPAKPIPPGQRTSKSPDSGALSALSASSASSASTSSTVPTSGAAAVVRGAPGLRPAPVRVPLGLASHTVAETTVVNTQKAIFKFSSIGAAPISVVVREYKNRSTPTDGPVQFAGWGASRSLVSYRLITPTDTADLSEVPFAVSRAKTANGDETLAYTASVGNHAVSISYVIPRD